MPVTIDPPVPDFTFNGHDYTNDDFENNLSGTLAMLVNDIAAAFIAADLVGTLNKTISGNVTLSGPESANISYIISGTLSGSAAVTFPGSFEGQAVVFNVTGGGFPITVGYATGTTVTVPSLGSALIIADGSNFYAADGIVRTNTGASVTGDLAVSGQATFSGDASFAMDAEVLGLLSVVDLNVTSLNGTTITATTLQSATGTFSGAVTIGTTLAVAGAVTLSDDLTVTGNLTATDAATFSVSSGTAMTLTGTAGSVTLRMLSPAGQAAYMQFDSSGGTRWLVGRNNGAESGSGAGSDLIIVRHDDGGIPAGTPVQIRRSDGGFFLHELPTSDPGESHRLWVDSNGFVRWSA